MFAVCRQFGAIYCCLLYFVTVGLVRAVDMALHQYYVTTPLSLEPEALDRVNVLAVGRVDILPSLLNNSVSFIVMLLVDIHFY